jgi:hypothetical protein
MYNKCILTGAISISLCLLRIYLLVLGVQNPLLRGVSVRVRPQVPLFKAPFLIERGFLMLLIY